MSSPPADRAGRAAQAFRIAAIVIVAARAACAFVPTTHLWALAPMRFLAPAWGWLPWAIAAAALVPAAARALAPALAGFGNALVEGRPIATLLWVTGAGVLAGALPDRVRFVGDFLLRQGTVEEAERPSVIFPQAMPLDVLLHYRLPLALAGAGVAAPNRAARALGAFEAGLLAALAIGFARALGRRGLGAMAVAALVLCGGYLAMFTGYSKAFGELVLVTVAAGVAGVTALRAPAGKPDAGALLGLGIAVALGVALHRSALSLVPGLVFVWGATLRRAPGAWKRPAAALAIALPVAAIAVLLPRVIADIRTFDSVHFTPAEVQAQGGPFAAALTGGRPLDPPNLVLLFAPLAVAAPFAAVLLGRARGWTRDGVFLILLAAPFVLAAPFIHPAQGLFRDWDDFAAAGAALALVTAWLAAQALEAAPRRAWIGVTMTSLAAAASLQWLAANADAERGLARVRAFVMEPPPRTAAERAKTWDYLGIVAYRRERWSEAADAFARSAETGPSQRLLLQWGMATTNAGDLAGAAAIYHRLLDRYPDTPLGWLGLGAVASRLADELPPGEARRARITESRRAGEHLLAMQPGNPDALRLLDYLRAHFGADTTGP